MQNVNPENWPSYNGMTAIRAGVKASLQVLMYACDLDNNDNLYELWLKLRRCMDYYNDNNM